MFLKTFIIWQMIYMTNCHHKSCPHILDYLATMQGELAQCITKHAVPVTMCINCNSIQEELLKSYDLLTANCSAMYFDRDRINIIASTQTVLKGLWSKAFCDDCFNNNTKEFNDKFVDFNDCHQLAKNDSCNKCKLQYMDLNNFYIKLDEHNNGEVCYELQDTMNRTRNTWSKELKCLRREHNLTLFSIALCIISVLPVLFYSSAYCITKRQERSHGILNDEAPIYNSELPTPSRQYNINNMSNSTRPMIPNSPFPSITDKINVSTITTVKPVHKNEYDDLESSDDDIQINALQ